MLVPLVYNLRSLLVRRVATLLTVVSIGATVAVCAGMLALRNGFVSMFAGHGRADVAVFLRPGSTNEGDSFFRRDLGDRLVKTLPEIARGANEQPLASMECYLGIRLPRAGTDKEIYVPVRGVQPMSFEVFAGSVEVVEGRNFEPGTDEVVVGRKLLGRVEHCQVGETIRVNNSSFRVVGVLASDGPYENEIWGDLERMLLALKRYGPNRVVARFVEGTDLALLNERVKNDREVPAKVMTERDYLTSQTRILGKVLLVLGLVLSAVMGAGAVFTAINTMLSAVASRTHEIGILLATGFRPWPVFFSFLLESVVLGLLGGAVGCVLVLPLNGIETSGMNWNTFTDVAFAFRITPLVLAQSIAFSLALGLIGGAWPAWRAARMTPTQALRRH